MVRIISTKKFAQVAPVDPNDPYLYDEFGKAVYDQRGIQMRRPTLKDDNRPFDNSLDTLTPDDIGSDFLVDDREDEGELPTEPEGKEIEEKEYPEFNTLFQAFRWGKENREVMRFYYITVKGTYIIRDIEPHGDFWARTTLKRILVTWDETAEASGMAAQGGIPFARAFRLENVQKYDFIGKQFEPKFNFSTVQHNYKRRLRRRKQKREHDRENNNLM